MIEFAKHITKKEDIKESLKFMFEKKKLIHISTTNYPNGIDCFITKYNDNFITINDEIGNTINYSIEEITKTFIPTYSEY